jgi:hypothetical protein
MDFFMYSISYTVSEILFEFDDLYYYAVEIWILLVLSDAVRVLVKYHLNISCK